MTTLSWIRRLFATPAARESSLRRVRGVRARCHLEVEALETRLAPSASNGLIAFTSYRDFNAEIYVMNADGTGQTRLTNNTANDRSPTWSPDGSKIAFSSERDGNAEIYVMNADGTGLTNLSNNPAHEFYPAWSPDGSKIAFTSRRDGNSEIYVMNADGTGQIRLTNTPFYDIYPTWSPDGSKIAFQSLSLVDFNDEIYVMNANGTGRTNLSNNLAADDFPAWSPDGSKITFTTDRDGNGENYVMNANGSGQTNVSNNGGPDSDSVWSPDGSKIVFTSLRDGNTEIYVMNTDGSGQTRLTNDLAQDNDAAWQPAPPNAAPSVALANTVTTLSEDTSTTSAVKVADIVVTDDTQGANVLSLSGADAGLFEIVGAELYLKAGTSLDFETKPSLDVTVNVDDATVGSTPDDSAALAISLTNINEAPTVAVPDAQTAFEDVDKALSGITVGDPDGGSLTVTLSVGHGDLTLGTTTGLTVSDNGTGAVTLSGSIADLNAALVSLVYRGSLNYGGDDTLSVTANDGNLSPSDSVAITMTSAAQQAADLQAQVTALRTAEVLAKRKAAKLTKDLKLKGDSRDIGKVQKFLTHVAGLRDSGVLTQAQADALLEPGNVLLLSVTR